MELVATLLAAADAFVRFLDALPALALSGPVLIALGVLLWRGLL